MRIYIKVLLMLAILCLSACQSESAVGNYSYYSQLTANEQSIYDSIEDAILNKTEKLPIKCNIIELQNARDALYYDKPQYLYVDFDKVTYSNEELSLSYKENIDIMKYIPECTLNDQYSIIEYYVSYLYNNVVYDYDDLNTQHNRDAYGALADKRSVCEGFAKALKLCLNYKGIPCITVSNDTHMWNYIYVNTKWVAIDSMRGTEISYSNDIPELKVESCTISPNGKRFVLPTLWKEEF